jgi:hypothetical protein
MPDWAFVLGILLVIAALAWFFFTPEDPGDG